MIDNGMLDLLLVIGLMIAITVAYFLLRRLIAWCVKDDNKWHKKQGHLGMSKDEMRNRTKLAQDRLTYGYLLFMFVLTLLLVIQIVG